MSKTPGDMVSSTTSSPSHHNTHTGMESGCWLLQCCCIKQHYYQVPLYIRCMCWSMRGLVLFHTMGSMRPSCCFGRLGGGWVMMDVTHYTHTCITCNSTSQIAGTRGWTSADRSTKATLMLTVPRSIFKSSTKDLTRPTLEIGIQRTCQFTRQCR